MGTVPAGGRKDLTDAQWRLLEPLLPAMSALRQRPIKLSPGPYSF